MEVRPAGSRSRASTFIGIGACSCTGGFGLASVAGVPGQKRSRTNSRGSDWTYRTRRMTLGRLTSKSPGRGQPAVFRRRLTDLAVVSTNVVQVNEHWGSSC